jgi:hypothetical protein
LQFEIGELEGIQSKKVTFDQKPGRNKRISHAFIKRKNGGFRQ